MSDILKQISKDKLTTKLAEDVLEAIVHIRNGVNRDVRTNDEWAPRCLMTCSYHVNQANHILAF